MSAKREYYRQPRVEFVRACAFCGARVYPGQTRTSRARSEQPLYCPDHANKGGGSQPYDDPRHLRDALGSGDGKWDHLRRENWQDEHPPEKVEDVDGFVLPSTFEPNKLGPSY